jgi:urea transporter
VIAASTVNARSIAGTATSILRGAAQVDFMPSAFCGAFFFAALFTAGWQYALGGLLGAAVSTLTAYVFKVDHARIAMGLEGFNGCLVGIAGVVFLGAQYASTWLLAAVGAVAVSIVTAALVTLLGTWQIPTLTFPFCIGATAMTLGATEFERLWHGRPGLAELGQPATGTTTLHWHDLWLSFFANFAQIFLMPQWYVGLLFLIGIFVASRRAALVASLGSVVGTATAWLLGSPAEEVRSGLVGYNAVLVALALGGALLSLSGWGLVYAMFGAALSTMVAGALTDVFAPFGGHTLTWPFCLTTLILLLAVPALPRLRPTVPEEPRPTRSESG